LPFLMRKNAPEAQALVLEIVLSWPRLMITVSKDRTLV